MALAIDIADAVVTELAGGAFSQPISPVRRVLPEYELADLKDLRVTVVPAAVVISGAAELSYADAGAGQPKTVDFEGNALKLVVYRIVDGSPVNQAEVDLAGDFKLSATF